MLNNQLRLIFDWFVSRKKLNDVPRIRRIGIILVLVRFQVIDVNFLIVSLGNFCQFIVQDLALWLTLCCKMVWLLMTSDTYRYDKLIIVLCLLRGVFGFIWAALAITMPLFFLFLFFIFVVVFQVIIEAFIWIILPRVFLDVCQLLSLIFFPSINFCNRSLESLLQD